MGSNRTRHLFVALASVAVLFAASVGPRDAAGQTPAGEPYKIGVTYPLSGPQGAWGQVLGPAMEIGARDAGQRQGPFRVLPEHADREVKLPGRQGGSRAARHAVRRGAVQARGH